MKRTERRDGSERQRRVRSAAAKAVAAALGALSLTAFAGLTEHHLASAADPVCAVPEVSVMWAWSGGEVPPVQTPGQDWHRIAHPTNTLLSFVAPADWSRAVLAVPPAVAGTPGEYSWAGIRATSADATTAVEVATAPVAGIHDATEAAEFGLNGIFPGQQPNILCSNDFGASGSSVIVAELGGTIVYVAGYATPHEGLDQTVYVYYTAVAPMATFATATENAFIAIFYQFLG